MGALEIAAALAASRRAVRLYPPEHPAHREAIRDLVGVVHASVDVRPLVLNQRDGRLYEGSEVITEAGPATRALVEAMEARRVESLTFHTGFTEVDAEGLSEVLSMRPSPDLQVGIELEERGVTAVTVSELEDNTSRQAEERDRQREVDRALYRQTLTGLNSIVNAMAEDRRAEPVEARRAIAQLIDRVGEDPHAILALATMTGHGERWRFHAVSVMLYALVLGYGIGVPDRALLALGLAGLLHDIGSVLPAEAGGTAVREQHPIAGAHALGAVPNEDCLAMIVAFEHHMGVSGAGFPERAEGYVTHPYSRIVAVGDRYDNLIRPAQGRAMRPDEAVAQLLQEADGGFLDEALVRVFIQQVGVLPVSTVVRLDDFSVGIVRAPSGDPLRPRVRLVLGCDGTELRPSVDVDLADSERTIVEVIPAALLDLQPSDHL